jgi:GNAT superfamily N-acetyltransferase
MHFPVGSPAPWWDRPGTVSLIVRPNARRQGVATRLVAAARAHGLELDPEIQDYTHDGRALRVALEARPS